MNKKVSGETPAAGKFAGDRKPPPKLAGGDRKFRQTQPLDRQKPEASPYAQKLENQEELVETNKPTTGEGAAGGSRRPKVYRTSGNPPMTTPGTRTSPASSWDHDLSPDAEKREMGGWGRGVKVASGWPTDDRRGGTAATKEWPDCGGRRERGTGRGGEARVEFKIARAYSRRSSPLPRLVNGKLTVDGIDFYVSEDFGEGLYNSCKDVKFGSMNTRAIDFVGAGAKNYKEMNAYQSIGFPEWFAFIGQQAELGMPGSPYTINFRTSVPKSSGMKLMNVSVYSCNNTLLGCSCGDCPSAPVCSSLEPPHSQTKDSCTVKIGSLKVKCIDFSMAILYILLVSAFLGWGFFHGNAERSELPSSGKPLLDKIDSVEEETDDNVVQKVSASIPQFQSTIQGLMADVFRRYGLWVARNPILVLCSSIAIVLILCLGLFRFKVETRPEKVFVSLSSIGPGSKAAEEKHFFDSHLAPFYRIEQVMLATKPDPLTGKSPSIVTDDNIQLLFEIQQKVDELTVNYSGSRVSLTDICLKPLGDDCAIQSVLQYFQMDADNYDYSGGVEHALYCFEHYTSADTCLSAFKGPLDPSTVLGGFSGNNFSEATAFVVTYPVNNIIDESSDAIRKIVEWERAFIKLAKEELLPMVQSSNLTISFSSESSIEDELKRESNADVITISISYLVMFAYVSLTLGDRAHLSSLFVSSKVLLGLSGVVVVILSVLGSVGFFSAIGLKSTLIIMEVIPFLVLAVSSRCILFSWAVCLYFWTVNMFEYLVKCMTKQEWLVYAAEQHCSRFFDNIGWTMMMHDKIKSMPSVLGPRMQTSSSSYSTVCPTRADLLRFSWNDPMEGGI
ncbi:hypothetical protein Cgig2_032413 [Carnegiea gigantea]|uniref:SSD domain-containing protein n=1 Tax=Carnegiea gigantea TaxID=171969 RepID=A0A9Q1KWF1_9CARY|nr:hypothetical protein Cgig2_032413 [Carnegiea gigantea]